MPENPSLSSTTAIVRNENFIEAEIDNEVVTLNIESGICHGLNRTGSRIWRLLASPIKIKDICATLVNEYNVDPNDCERQVIDLLKEMQTEGLVRTADGENST